MPLVPLDAAELNPAEMAAIAALAGHTSEG